MVKNYKTLLISSLVLTALALIAFSFKIPVLESISVWSVIAFLLVLCGKKSILQKKKIEDTSVKEIITAAIFIALVIALCVLPMGVAPFWNGKIPLHRNQYELTADAILDGHLYIEYDDMDPRLLEMENPYDYDTRLKEQIIYHYDHAFYNGHYYMYFGVVPVFLLFIPFKLIFGHTLVTYHATQFFVMMGIIAIFLLFYNLARKFCKSMALGTYLFVSAAVSLIVLGYCTQAPALYCTAISGGVSMALWGLMLYSYGVFIAKKEWLQVLLCTLASLAAALGFGCRPTAALGCIVAIPLAVYYAKHYEGKHIVRNFAIIAIPYFVIAALLMTYNYVRFENPFEFGQAYQLTTYDQTQYGNIFARFSLATTLNSLFYNFLDIGEFTPEFPFVNYGGMLVGYPLMWLIVPLATHKESISEMKKDKMGLVTLFLALTPVFITLVDIQWAPGLCERYRLDEYYLMGILAFILILYRLKTVKRTETYSTTVSVFAVVSMVFAFLYFMRPCDANIADNMPELAENIRKVVLFGL